MDVGTQGYGGFGPRIYRRGWRSRVFRCLGVSTYRRGNRGPQDVTPYSYSDFGCQ